MSSVGSSFSVPSAAASTTRVRDAPATSPRPAAFQRRRTRACSSATRLSIAALRRRRVRIVARRPRARAAAASSRSASIRVLIAPISSRSIVPDPLAVRRRPWRPAAGSACQTASAPGGDLAIAVQQAHGRADERPVLAALDVDGLAPARSAPRSSLVDPAEVGAEEVAVAELQLHPMRAGALGRPGRRDRLAARRSRPAATVPSASVSRMSGSGQKKPRPFTRIRPIMPDNHQQADAQAGPGEPDRRIAPAQQSRAVSSDRLVPLAQALADDLRHGVQRERHDEEQRGRQEQRAVQRAALRRLGNLDGDVGRQRPEAVEDRPVDAPACCRSPSARSSSRRPRGRSRP